ncbi:MAG TPA: hypothetical protein DHU89_03585 [Flavobacteriales bacterium]|nr:hypothetical protein [Flavobacteriales bacterium]
MNKTALYIIHTAEPAEASLLTEYSISTSLKYLKLYNVNKALRGSGGYVHSFNLTGWNGTGYVIKND